MNLSDFHERSLAVLWFAAFALLCVAVMFHRLTMARRGIFLYVLLPIVASGIAGGLCGGPIVNRAKTRTMGQSLVRGVTVAATAFAIFSLLFVLALPFIDRGWSLRQSGGLLLLISTLGVLLAGPIVLSGGMLAGATLYLFGRVVFVGKHVGIRDSSLCGPTSRSRKL